ncbi:hypothetical protein BH09PAT3_BH09PAT3_6670 [soil metagenome]
MRFAERHIDTTFVAPDMFGLPKHDEVIEAAIATDQLPFDTWLRLRAVGDYVPDWQGEERLLSHGIAKDIAEHVSAPEDMRPDTKRLLWGDRPDGVIDWEQSTNRQAYTTLDVMYYRMANLARVIKQQRKLDGATVTEVPDKWYVTPDEFENTRCFGLARPLWRIIVQRTHPEWLERPAQYCSSTTFTMWSGARELSEGTMKRRIIGAAVFSDEVVYDIYEEATRTGVKGIAAKGRESLRNLLADEHPELY